MEIKDLFRTYEAKRTAWQAVEEKAAQLRLEAAKLDERASKKRERAKKALNEAEPFPDWIKEIAVPIADELARRKGLQAKVLGPMGIGCRIVIALVSDPEKSTYVQEHYRLNLQPDIVDEKISLVYETGEMSGKYKKGTLGEASGLNFITAPLPNSIDEIEKLLIKEPARK